MSATDGLLPSNVVRVDRCVFRDPSRSACFASSSSGVAKRDAVVIHCVISIFSLSVKVVSG